MTSYYFELSFRVSAPSPDDLDEHLDNLMDALIDEPGATDADIGATLASGEVTISMYIDADADDQAISRALVVARSAIHKAGGFTGGWLSDSSGGPLPVDDTYNLRVQAAELIDC